jgi:orotidine-5'-phosphate decarboxylase
MAETAPSSRPLRERLALALDVPDLASARSLARVLAPWFAVVKVGLELYVAEGPAAVATFVEDGLDVFVDLKLHDIPTTVHRAARAIAHTGARYATVHAAGGAQMLAEAAAGFSEGAADAGRATPTIGLAVTVLTSDADPAPALVVERAALAARAGLGGVVCAVADVRAVRAAVPGMITVVPGVRPRGVARDDQSRAGTPEDALAAGADLLVVGRAVTRAESPAAAARALAETLESALPR